MKYSADARSEAASEFDLRTHPPDRNCWGRKEPGHRLRFERRRLELSLVPFSSYLRYALLSTRTLDFEPTIKGAEGGIQAGTPKSRAQIGVPGYPRNALNPRSLCTTHSESCRAIISWKAASRAGSFCRMFSKALPESLSAVVGSSAITLAVRVESK